ncbi:LysR family transcriptional regulator [Photobacterium minamisatsumaniensis]|uniref:LysR family transcriptional regulator n=1 Tax=Photobacterium minamisatsumaniensis TaxID=2910233 RepID=UPI003D1472C7
MNLRQIEVFYAIMKAGSVSGAAKLLHVSQPNVTRILAHTEQQLGFTLFHRAKGRLVATEEAQKLLPEAENVYQQLNRFHSLTSKIQKGHQHLRIGAPPILASSLLPKVINHVCADEQISIELSTDNRAELCNALIQNQLDFIVCFGSEIPPAISGESLLSTKMVALLPLEPQTTLTPHLTSPLTEITLNQLVDGSYNIIGLDARDPLGFIVSQAIQQISPQYRYQISVRSYSAAAQLVAQGYGVAIVDPWTAQMVNKDVQVCSLKHALSIDVSILYADHNPLSPIAMTFIQQLKRMSQ